MVSLSCMRGLMPPATPVVESAGRFYLVSVEEVLPAEPRPLDEVRDEVKRLETVDLVVSDDPLARQQAVERASEEAVKKYGLKPIAKLKMYTTVGCESDEMGVGPRYAIPKLLDLAGMKTSDIGLWEINEAFACQVAWCRDHLGII